MDDWQIVVNLAAAFGGQLEYSSATQVREAVAASFPAVKDITTLVFARPVSAHTWLESSNPSERWKWDFMFKDLPPVKGALDPSALPPSPGVIPLKEIK
jgi:predicted molibdopterin-dependent oxidoreductase YjgC